MPADEADKFVLLPKDQPHDAVLWAAPPAPPLAALMGGALMPPLPPLPPVMPPPPRLGRTGLPHPPEDFVGRACDMHRVLASLRRRRIVFLTPAPASPTLTATAAAAAFTAAAAAAALPPLHPSSPSPPAFSSAMGQSTACTIHGAAAPVTFVRGVGLSTVAAALARHQDMRHAHADGVAFVRCPRVGGMAALASVLAAELGVSVAISGEMAADDNSAAGGGSHSAGGDLTSGEVNVAATVERLVEALQDKEALLVLDGVEALVAEPSFGALLHALLSRSLHLRLLLTTAAPLPTHLDLPAKVITYPLAGLAPIDAARLLARRVGRPLHELLPPAEPCGRHAAAVLAAFGGNGGTFSSGGTRAGGGAGGVAVGGRPPSPALPVQPPTLEELAAEPLLCALGGRPSLIVHAAAAISGRPAAVSVRTAFERASRAADAVLADEARRAG